MIRHIVDSFDRNDAVSIASAQDALANPNLTAQLAYIKSHFNTLPQDIEQLECTKRSMSASLSIVYRLQEQLSNVVGTVGVAAYEKLQSVLAKNPGFNDLVQISRALKGEPASLNPELEHDPRDIACFQFAPLSSCDVERSFSKYRYILSDRRRGFTFENLKMVLVVNCSYNTELETNTETDPIDLE